VFAGFARMFKLGKQAEDAIDRWSQMAQQEAAPNPDGTPKQKPPTPEQQAAALEMEKAKREDAREEAKAQREAQAKQQELAFKQQEHEMSMAFEQQKLEQQLALEQQKHSAKIMQDRERADVDRELAEGKMGIDAELAARKEQHTAAMREREVSEKVKLERDKWSAEAAPGPDLFASLEKLVESTTQAAREINERMDRVEAMAKAPRRSTIKRDAKGRATHADHEVIQ
jgi:hypothetical protein